MARLEPPAARPPKPAASKASKLWQLLPQMHAIPKRAGCIRPPINHSPSNWERRSAKGQRAQRNAGGAPRWRPMATHRRQRRRHALANGARSAPASSTSPTSRCALHACRRVRHRRADRRPPSWSNPCSLAPSPPSPSLPTPPLLIPRTHPLLLQQVGQARVRRVLARRGRRDAQDKGREAQVEAAVQ